jgi:hypothetical protein
MSLASRPVSQKKLNSNTVSKYSKDQKRKNQLVKKFKLQFDISSGFTLIRPLAQKIALDAVDRFMSPENNVCKFGIHSKAGEEKSALINKVAEGLNAEVLKFRF